VKAPGFVVSPRQSRRTSVVCLHYRSVILSDEVAMATEESKDPYRNHEPRLSYRVPSRVASLGAQDDNNVLWLQVALATCTDGTHA
jgi:hypothetical protein